MLVRRILRFVMAAGMTTMGILHFVRPSNFVAIMPPWIPEPLLMVHLSGVFEILGGVGLLIPKLRRVAGLGLIALFLAVFPANIHMALNNVHVPGVPPQPDWVLWVRLPFQVLFIAWAWWVSKPDETLRTRSAKNSSTGASS